ncbi:MAG: hypothetical protein DME80_04320 [Verrucomicrobia bacterium]|nr:MAG: hypothetical protein DME80_04320 [Verrucomicrobiota bacterium]
MHEITASLENCPLCRWRTSTEELIGWDCQFGTIDQTAPWRVEFCSRHVALPAKMNLHDLAFIRRSQDEPSGLDPLATLMRELTVVLTVLTVATFQTYAGSLDWLFDVVNNDNIARSEAQFLVWDGVTHPFSATFEKVDLVDKDLPFYLFHVVITSPGTGAERDRSSYLVCFKLTERATEFRIVTVIQNASDPPTENEIAIDKRLNRWSVSPPWKTGDDLPRHIKPPGLSIVLDKSRARSDQ